TAVLFVIIALLNCLLRLMAIDQNAQHAHPIHASHLALPLIPDAFSLLAIAIFLAGNHVAPHAVFFETRHDVGLYLPLCEIAPKTQLTPAAAGYRFQIPHHPIAFRILVEQKTGLARSTPRGTLDSLALSNDEARNLLSRTAAFL